ncbi:unnamed protein product [Paramecium sonneborni]|uniref:Uncharacterized protein n=1 Tax=Paramecium sonneborni TaxID=65129 RepID=A0A8S1MI12_9CILI|nr:unnamed protein product [Paramecium sonneborni]
MSNFLKQREFQYEEDLQKFIQSISRFVPTQKNLDTAQKVYFKKLKKIKLKQDIMICHKEQQVYYNFQILIGLNTIQICKQIKTFQKEEIIRQQINIQHRIIKNICYLKLLKKKQMKKTQIRRNKNLKKQNEIKREIREMAQQKQNLTSSKNNYRIHYGIQVLIQKSLLMNFQISDGSIIKIFGII